jgi:uncharacterized membrane protein
VTGVASATGEYLRAARQTGVVSDDDAVGADAVGPDADADAVSDGGSTLDPDSIDPEEADELIEQLEEVAETVSGGSDRRAIGRAISLVDAVAARRLFGLDDVAQQVVGGIILSAPFVVTEEVWNLAASMNPLQVAVTVFMVLAIGYGTLYRAEDRDVERERTLAGVPVRFLSLLVVSYGSVTLLAMVFDAPDTFDATTATTIKAICIGAVFSVVGAATADSLF